MSLSPRVVAIAVVLAVVQCSVQGSLHGQEEAAHEPFELATFLREAHATTPAELGQRIGARGPRLAAPVFLALRDETCPVTETSAMVIGPVEQEVLLIATRELGRASFATLFESALPAELDEDSRRAMLQVLGQVGKAQDVKRLLDLVSGETACTPAVVTAFEDAVPGILGRDARAVSGLRGRFLDLPEELAGALAQGIARVPSPAGLELLLQMVGYREPLDTMLLSLAVRVGRDLDGPFDETVKTKARLCLTDPDFQVLRQAAILVARLEDFESTELLIDLLDHEHAGVRASAHRALCELTGLNLRPDAKSWSSWYENELAWYQNEAPTLRRMLVHGSPVQVAEALRELARHRYDRHRTALDIAQVLEHDNRNLRKRACVALRQLQSRAPVGALIDSLEDEDAIAAEAHQTLRTLTGEDLPRDPQAWRNAPGRKLPG